MAPTDEQVPLAYPDDYELADRLVKAQKESPHEHPSLRKPRKRTTAEMQELGLRIVTISESSLMVWQGVKIVGTASVYAAEQALIRATDWLDNRFPALFPTP